MIEFAQPLLEDGPPAASAQELELRLHVAVTIWNAIVLDERGVPGGFVAEARTRVALGGLPGVLDFLVTRKRELFADDQRLIGDFSVRSEPDGEFTVRAEARGDLRDVPTR